MNVNGVKKGSINAIFGKIEWMFFERFFREDN